MTPGTGGLVGRETELAGLSALASSRLPAVALVSGPPGIGKSLLVRTFADTWPGPVLAGSAAPEVTSPFGVLREALVPHVGRWHSLPQSLADQASAVGALIGDAAPARIPKQARPDALHRAAVDMLRHALGDEPGLLVMEDLHWADAESVGAVSRFIRAADLPALIVATYRPEEVSRPLAALLNDLRRRASVMTLPLTGLSLGETRALLERRASQSLSDRAVTLAHRRSGGNPLFLEELVDHVTELDSLADAALPRSVAEAVLARSQRLAPATTEVAEATATLDSVVPFDLLRAATGLTEGDLLRRVRQLVDAGLLVEPVPDVFGFRHELIREAFASRLLSRERRRIHSRAYDLLKDNGDHAALARHAALADRPGDVVRHAAAGARARHEQGFTLDALSLAELGLTATGDDASHAELRQVAALAARNAGLYEEAERHAKEWTATAQAVDDREDEVAALLLLAELDVSSGRLGRAGDRLAQARVAAGRTPNGLVRCAALAARIHMLAEEADAAISEADAALALMDGDATDEDRAAILVTKGTALTDAHDATAGLALIEQGRELAEARGDVFTVARALLNVLSVVTYDNGEAAGWAAYELARQHLLRHGVASVAGNVARCGADLAVRDGDLGRARRILDAQLADELDPVEAAAIAGKTGVLAIEAGDHKLARSLLDTYYDDVERIDQHWVRTYLCHLDVAYASRLGAAEDIQSALARYQVAVDPRSHARRPARAASAARHALQGGARHDVVQDFLRDVLSEATEEPTWWRTQLDAALAATAGDHERVLALGVPPSGWSPHLDADAHLTAARSATALGDGAVAGSHARRARALLKHWPGWRRDDAEAMLTRPEFHTAPVELTHRQLDVLSLVTEGLTNQQIASRLAISPRTVAVHVSNLLDRTGRRSRTELATWALREQRVADRIAI